MPYCLNSSRYCSTMPWLTKRSYALLWMCRCASAAFISATVRPSAIIRLTIGFARSLSLSRCCFGVSFILARVVIMGVSIVGRFVRFDDSCDSPMRVRSLIALSCARLYSDDCVITCFGGALWANPQRKKRRIRNTR